MRYVSRAEIEHVGRTASKFEVEDGIPKAWVMDSFWLYCDPDDLGFTPHMTERGEGFWESWITRWMDVTVEPGSRCLDIGANMGFYTMFLAANGCDVRAIEPQPSLAKLIRKSVKANEFNVTVSQSAISDEAGTVKMIVPTGHGMNASLAYEPISPHGYEEIEVKAITMNDIPGKWDFAKIDVEGAEDKVFRGADEFIERNPECVWLLEWRWDRMKAPMTSAREIFKVMDVSWVNFEGVEIPLSLPEELADRQNEDWMLVLRRKK